MTLVPVCDLRFDTAAVRDIAGPVWFHAAPDALTLYRNRILCVRVIPLGSEDGLHRVMLPGGKAAIVTTVYVIKPTSGAAA